MIRRDRYEDEEEEEEGDEEEGEVEGEESSSRCSDLAKSRTRESSASQFTGVDSIRSSWLFFFPPKVERGDGGELGFFGVVRVLHTELGESRVYTGGYLWCRIWRGAWYLGSDRRVGVGPIEAVQVCTLVWSGTRSGD